jgi:uridine kinase
MKKRLIIILGPTASGKTDMAVKIAQHFDTETVPPCELDGNFTVKVVDAAS